MKINFRQGVVSHQETGFLEPNGSGGVRIAASTRSTTITLAHRDTNYTHSEDNNVENAWPGPFPAGENYYLYWDFNQLTYLRSFGYTTLEPVSQSVPPGHGNSPIVSAVPGVASPVAFGSFEVEGHYVLASGKVFAVVGSTGSPNNDGLYTVQNAVYDLVTGNTTITVNEAVATSTVSGELTLDIDSKGLPLFVNGRHWYDTANNIHYVLDVQNQWVEVLRVFAANLFNGTTFLSMSQNAPLFTGTQIGDNSSVASGRVLFGDAGNPIRRDDNTFFTTEDQFFTNQSRVDAIRLESNVARAQAFSSSLAQFGIVAWRDDGQIASADYDDTGSTVVGVLTESIIVGQVGAVITQGSVTNSSWNWTASLAVGAPLWIQNGELVGIDPFISDNATYSIKQVPVARVLSVDTIIFEQGLGGVGPQGATGTVTDLSVATSSTSGVVWITDTTIDTSTALVPVAVSDKHSVITGGPYSPLAHSHTALQTSFTPGNNIAASDVQNAIAELAIEKLSLTGGTMSGLLTLSGIPTADFHAAPKQYVDALFQGIDAKEASLVGTTDILGDIGGLYSSIGGTGGTGAITNALISQLDGVFGIDYDLAISTRILVKDQDDAKENGIYVVTALGAGSPPVILDIERAPDFDSNDEIRAGNYTVIRAGATQAGQGWVLTDIHPEDDIELNDHDINWALVSSAAAYLGSSTIDIDGSLIISVIPNTVAALSATSATNSTQWNTETITLTGSPATGQSLIYNAGTSTWENGTPASDLCDLVVTCLPGSDTITSTKDLFALNINSNTGLSINATVGASSGFDISGIFDPSPISTVTYPYNPNVNPSGKGFLTPDGTTFFWVDGNATGTEVYTSTLGTAFDISTAGVGSVETVTGGANDGARGITFNTAGTVMLIQKSFYISEFTLGTPWDVSSYTYVDDSSIFDGNGSVYHSYVYFSKDGLHAYQGAQNPSYTVAEYVLGAAFDISTASYVQNYDFSSDFTPANPHVSISTDGTQLFVLGYDEPPAGTLLVEYALSPAWDVSSATFVQSGMIPEIFDFGRSMFWNEDGTSLYYADSSDTVFQYTTGTAGATTTNTTLYYDGSESLSTISTGVEVTGILTFAAAGSPTSNPQIVLPNYTTAALPATTFEGGMVYDTDTNRVKFYNGVSWIDPHASAVSALDDLSDVTIAGSPGFTLASGQILEYNGAQWVNTAPTVVAELNDLTDVVIGSPPTTNDVLTYDGADWVNQPTPAAEKPSFEKIALGGSPVSQVLNTTVDTIATGGSPIQTASLQVFRNGILQNEGDVAGSPITNDFEVTGANQLTFAPGTLQAGGVVIIYVFN